MRWHHPERSGCKKWTLNELLSLSFLFPAVLDLNKNHSQLHFVLFSSLNEERSEVTQSSGPAFVLHIPEEWDSQARNRAWCWDTTVLSFQHHKQQKHHLLFPSSTDGASLPIQSSLIWQKTQTQTLSFLSCHSAENLSACWTDSQTSSTRRGLKTLVTKYQRACSWAHLPLNHWRLISATAHVTQSTSTLIPTWAATLTASFSGRSVFTCKSWIFFVSYCSDWLFFTLCNN